jgi:hypothetical protein
VIPSVSGSAAAHERAQEGGEILGDGDASEPESGLHGSHRDGRGAHHGHGRGGLLGGIAPCHHPIDRGTRDNE